MKYFIFLIFSFYIFKGYTADMVPLRNYLQDNEIKNDKILRFKFYARCSAILVYTSGLMKSPNMIEMKENFSMLVNIYILKMSKIISSKKNQNKQKEKIEKELMFFLSFYKDLGNKNYIEFGDYLADIHYEDTKVCTDFSKKEF